MPRLCGLGEAFRTGLARRCGLALGVVGLGAGLRIILRAPSSAG